MEYKPRASPELVAGYEIAATMADRRGGECEASGRIREAGLWRELGEYCQLMADTRAIDDGDNQLVNRPMRKGKEVPMSQEQQRIAEEEGELLSMWNGAGKPLSDWKMTAMELALGYLSPLQRVCYEMHVAGRLSYGDIAHALTMTRNEAHRHVQRARKTIERKVRPAMAHVFDRSKVANDDD